LPDKARNEWGESGGSLSIVYSTECVDAESARRPAAMLPLLVILFIVSYGILALLVFKQGETIESQRGLIREVLKDSTQLAAMKGKLAGENSTPISGKASAQTGQKAAKPGNPVVETKKPGKETKPTGKSTRNMRQIPGKPAADLEDVRRSTQVI
jgi:hypothetical protein